MDREMLRRQWLHEEEIAHIRGWDFSHIKGRYTEKEALPWDYAAVIREYLLPSMRILDLDTGGGEFLLSLCHPYALTAATENYPPNIALCRDTLSPLGIDFRPADAEKALPFDSASFDMVINRHGSFHPGEIARVLKPGGYFITQQVGAENDRELVQLLLGDLPLPFPGQYPDKISARFRQAGFQILRVEECFRPIRFYDVGALVWFARIIQWEFPGFSVDASLDRLFHAQQILDQDGVLSANTHRILLAAQKEG